MSYFLRVRWLSEDPDDPVVLWSHVVDGWEIRKVDEFADGHLVWADGGHESGSTRLGSAPVPSPEEIADDPQFAVDIIDEPDFEFVWRKTRADA
ncbi:DUF6881 domain-containing protein [Microbacterium deminutum]